MLTIAWHFLLEHDDQANIERQVFFMGLASLSLFPPEIFVFFVMRGYRHSMVLLRNLPFDDTNILC